MHSKIFQIQSKPIDKDDYITESRYDYDDWFLREIADYVADIDEDDQLFCIKWLSNINGIEVYLKNRTLVVSSKEKYFDGKYKTFQEELDRLKNISFSDFVSDSTELRCRMYALKDSYDDKYGFYVDDDGEWGGLITLDEFVRNAKENITYYIGGVVDYHF